jgi:AraC family transcriptional regulator
MEPVIVTRSEFSVIGVCLETSTTDGRNFREIPEFWEKVLGEKQLERIPNRKKAGTTLGICLDFREDGGFSYIIGAEVTSTQNIPEGMVAKILPQALYAVFTARGEMPGSIQKTVKAIYEEWFPNSRYRRADTADFELYDERSCAGENAEVDIYVPIVPA